jgi:hypothetical protein
VLWFIEGNPNVRLCSQVIDLVGLDLGQQRYQACTVAQVAIVKEELRLRIVRIHVQVVNTGGVES